MTSSCVEQLEAPVTGFGRKFNALKTGWTAETSLLPGENRKAFMDLLRQFFLEHLPQGPTEVKLVTALAKAEWRAMRIESSEADVLEKDGLGSKTYNNWARYLREARAEFYKALHALMAWRRLAIQQERHDEKAPQRIISTRVQRDETISALWYERVLGNDVDHPDDDPKAVVAKQFDTDIG